MNNLSNNEFAALCLTEAIELLDETIVNKPKESGLDKFKRIHDIKAEKGAIGFSRKEQKWYGWSHRAIHGFGVGDKCKNGECGVGEGYNFKPGDKLKTLEDCKIRARDFARSVS